MNLEMAGGESGVRDVEMPEVNLERVNPESPVPPLELDGERAARLAISGGRRDVIAKHGRCGICLYADLEHAGTVECRRYPPAPYFEPTGRVTNIRPRVGAYYWCGEYRDKMAEAPAA